MVAVFMTKKTPWTHCINHVNLWADICTELYII